MYSSQLRRIQYKFTSCFHQTDALSSMYYESKWEAVIQHSSNAKANVRLMKFVTLSMAINKKPFNLTGMNFFHVSLAAALTVRQLSQEKLLLNFDTVSFFRAFADTSRCQLIFYISHIVTLKTIAWIRIPRISYMSRRKIKSLSC